MFVIVRHGNTFAAGEAPRRIGARTDLPLTEAGQAQAEALGQLFAARGWHFGRALVSPLQRTRLTARLILAAQPGSPPEPELCDWLREIDHGPDEDKDEATVLARIGADALQAWDSAAIAPPGWTVNAPARRAAWQRLFAAPPLDRPTLVVTSNGAARFALQAEGLDGVPPQLKLPTGGYGVMRRGEHGRLVVEGWGLRP